MNVAWSRGVSLLGLSLAAESSHLLTWGEPPQLTLWQHGEVRVQRQAAEPLQAGACAGDGSLFAVAGKTGRLWALGPNLRTRWELQLPAPALALAFDPLGDLLAVSDAEHNLHLFQAHNGRSLWRVQAPRPLHHLAFVPEQPFLIGAADTALVIAYDPAGHCCWRTGLAVHFGSLAVQGDGRRIALAGYGEGPVCLELSGQRSRALHKLGPCRRLAMNYDGRLVLAEDLVGRILIGTGAGARLDTWTPTGRILDFVLSPLGERFWLALAEGTLQEIVLQESKG